MQFICLSRIWFVGTLNVDLERTQTHKHTQKAHFITRPYSFYRPCPMMTMIVAELFQLYLKQIVCMCVCVRTRLNISPKIKQTPASNVFFFLFTMLAINWAHPYNHREEKRLFNLFFVLLFNLSMWCCWFVRRTHIYLFLKEKESEIEKSERERRKKQQKMANLFFYLMKKRDISHFQTKFVQFF